jgi:hypothetical protein
MYVGDEQILGACLPILRKAKKERSGDRPFLTAQQIWITLQRNRHWICAQLTEYYRRGRNNGQSEALQRIAEALAQAPYIETRHLDARYVVFDPMEEPEFGAGGLTCRIFRLV